MDIKKIKESVVTHIYHVPSDKKVPLHKHDKHDEIFYCIKGSGFGILENEEIELNVGETFIAPAGKIHSMRSDKEIYVCAFLVPIVDDRSL